MVGMTLAVSAGSRPVDVAKASLPAAIPTPETSQPLIPAPEIIQPAPPVPRSIQPAEPAPTPAVEPVLLPVEKPAPRPLDDTSVCSTGDTYGTAVHFLNNPIDAGRQAARENKLLFVLHLSGNLEDDAFT
jgi:hypothetical protein